MAAPRATLTAPALIDDDTPTPAHARFSRAACCATVLAVVPRRCGLAALGALALAHGWQGTLTQMGWFFTKAALLTFGGAYAVLPYVYQGAVEHAPVAERRADDRRPRARRNDARPADHGRGLRRLRRRLARRRCSGPTRWCVAGALRRRASSPSSPSCRRSSSSCSARRSSRATHGKLQLHRAAGGDHRGGGRRDRQPGAVLRAARAVAARLRRCASTWRRR